MLLRFDAVTSMTGSTSPAASFCSATAFRAWDFCLITCKMSRMRSRMPGALSTMNSATDSLHNSRRYNSVRAALRLGWSSGQTPSATRRASCIRLSRSLASSWGAFMASPIQTLSNSAPGPILSNEDVKSPARCRTVGSRLASQRASSASTDAIEYITAGSSDPFIPLRSSNTWWTMFIASTSLSPASTSIRRLSKALHKHFTSTRNSASTLALSTVMQKLLRWEGNTSPPSSTSPSDSFCAANLPNKPTFVVRASSTPREWASRGDPLLRSLALRRSRW
mmetsp:Transcript_12516/g.35848  ORF Transcript_12516/g.35848 Transcript_12516/m.35848 type:complete len:280 (-) Transcript_12516:356-1195(-)